MSDFSFINNLNVATETTTNKRGGSNQSIDPVFKTTSTKGNLALNTFAVKGLGIAEGDRVAITELPKVLKDLPVTIEKTGLTYAITRGSLSNSEMLGMEYEVSNPAPNTKDKVELEAYETAKEAWVASTMEERQLPDNAYNGAKIAAQGSGYLFSSRNTWTLLGGNVTGSNYFNCTVCFGIAQMEDGSAVLITEDNKEIMETAVVVARISRDFNPVWVPVTDLAEVENYPFYLLTFENFKVKSARGAAKLEEAEVVETEVAETVATDPALDEVVDDLAL